jgi:hypothetical protein
MSEAEKLTAFLLALQTSQTQRERFRRNPRGEMQRFNLAPGTIVAVLGKNTDKIWQILEIPAIRVQVAKVVGVEKKRRRRKRT